MSAAPNVVGLWAAALVVCLGVALRPGPIGRLPADIARAPRPIRPRPHLPTRRGRPGALGPDEVASWCDGLARSVRTGAPLLVALRSVDPPPQLRGPLADVHHDLDRGRPLDVAVAHFPSDPNLALVLSAVLASRANGVDPSTPLEQIAVLLRGRAADAAELRSQSAQARASSQVMTLLPIVMLTLLVATSGMVREVVTTPLGSAMTLAGAGLNLAGWAWMRRLIRRATR